MRPERRTRSLLNEFRLVWQPRFPRFLVGLWLVVSVLPLVLSFAQDEYSYYDDSGYDDSGYDDSSYDDYDGWGGDSDDGSSDADGDGLLDVDELAGYEILKPYESSFYDESTGEEVTYLEYYPEWVYTDPTLKDTDGDLIEDLIELQLYMDPTDPSDGDVDGDDDSLSLGREMQLGTSDSDSIQGWIAKGVQELGVDDLSQLKLAIPDGVTIPRMMKNWIDSLGGELEVIRIPHLD